MFMIFKSGISGILSCASEQQKLPALFHRTIPFLFLTLSVKSQILLNSQQLTFPRIVSLIFF